MFDHLADLLAQLPDAVLVTDDSGIVLWANAKMADLMEAPLDEWLGRSFLEAVHPDCGVSIINALANVVHRPVGEPGALIKVRLVTGTGGVREVEARGSMLQLPDRTVLVNVVREIDDRFDRDVDGGDPDRLRALIDHSPAVLTLLDDEYRILTASGALTRLLGHDNFLDQGRRLTELVAPDHRSMLLNALETMDLHLHLTLDLPDVWGGVRHFDAHFADLRNDPTVKSIVATLTDVSDLKTAERRLQELANIDPLTGALNRRKFTESLDAVLDETSDVAVLFIDLDRFKPINDQFGHAAGDAVLIEVAERLRRAVRGADLVSRLGGDEFAIALIGEAMAGSAATVRRIHRSMFEPIDVGDHLVTVGASIGSAMANPGLDAGALLGRADAAMYRRKASRSGAGAGSGMSR